jgi:hypothetical protein
VLTAGVGVEGRGGRGGTFDQSEEGSDKGRRCRREPPSEADWQYTVRVIALRDVWVQGHLCSYS